jgi:hypothetical protein
VLGVINQLRKGEKSLFIVIGNTSGLSEPMIGEDEGVNREIRGSEAQRGAWMAKELVIATLRLGASRQMPIWMSSTSKYCSLAALLLSEYSEAKIAEPFAMAGRDREDSLPLLNFYHSESRKESGRSKPSWQQMYAQNGVIDLEGKTLSFGQALQSTRAKNIVCIGAGPKISEARSLAQQCRAKVFALDFTKAAASRDRKQNSTGVAQLEDRLLKARDELRPYRARTKQDERRDIAPNDIKAPTLLHLLPPVPLLVYWQLNEFLR